MWTDGFIPRGQCGGWSDGLIALYAISELCMFIGYLMAAFVFTTYLRKRHVKILSKIFVFLAGVFTLCGLTHAMGLLSFFWPAYWLFGWINVTSGIMIVLLLIAMVPMLPRIMKFPRASEMEKVNLALREEITGLLQDNAALSDTNARQASENIQEAIAAIRAMRLRAEKDAA